MPASRHIAQLPRAFLRGTMSRALPDQMTAPQTREFAIDAAQLNTDKRTLEVCFSTETPVFRWGVNEVLSHDTGAVDLSRLNDGAAVLFNHDRDVYIGVVESARIDADRKGRAVLRFGTREMAEQVFSDIKDGLLKHVSVGYQVHEWRMDGGEQVEVETWTATRWEPYEISIVTVPADKNAGVGRQQNFSQTSKTNAMNRAQIIAALNERGIKFNADATDEELQNLLGRHQPADSAPTPAPAPAPAPEAAQRAAVTTANPPSTIAILDLARQYQQALPNARDLAEDAIRQNHDLATFQRTLLEAMNARGTRALQESANVGLSEKDINNFSFRRFLLAAAASPTDKRTLDAAAYELEVSQAAAQKMSQAGREVRGLVIPFDVLQNAGRRDIVSNKSGSGYTGTGSNVIKNELLVGSFFELLRNRCVLIQHATPLGGLQGAITIPKQTGHATAGWIGEDDEAPSTDVKFGQVSLSHKTVAAYSQITRDMLRQPSIDVEAFVRLELARSQAHAIDIAGFYGTGTGGQPLGIKNVSGINSHTFASCLDYSGLVAMETAIAADNADIGSMLYMLNATVRGAAKTKKKFADSGTDAVLWEPGNTLNGYATEVTNQINSTDLFFGVWSELIYAMWGGIEVLADQDVKTGRIAVSAFQDVNFLVRRPECFCVGDLTPPEPEEE